eukprot:g33587.t1
MQHKEQAQRESSEVLSATQVSDVATIAPEEAREDEERLEEQRTLQSSLREALNIDSKEAEPAQKVHEEKKKDSILREALNTDSNEAEPESSDVLTASEVEAVKPNSIYASNCSMPEARTCRVLAT